MLFEKMLHVTKIFRFETAHAIYGYPGPCSNIHGHSYILHVSVVAIKMTNDYLPSPGFIMDFKELKSLVQSNIMKEFDHQLILSSDYIKNNISASQIKNLRIWEMEPTVENMLLFIKNRVQKELPKNVMLYKLKIYETNDSYAEWEFTR